MKLQVGRRDKSTSCLSNVPASLFPVCQHVSMWFFFRWGIELAPHSVVTCSVPIWPRPPGSIQLGTPTWLHPPSHTHPATLSQPPESVAPSWLHLILCIASAKPTWPRPPDGTQTAASIQSRPPGCSESSHSK